MLKTKRLILREPRLDDLDGMCAVYSDPQTMQFWSTEPDTNREATQVRLQKRIERWQASPTNFHIEMDDQFIGVAGNSVNTEIGFILNRKYWRQGIVTEAMTAIIPHLWQTTDYPELTADADPNNLASIGCLMALGFRETHRASRTFFINGVWSDSIYLSLPRPAALALTT